ncbi:histone-lysine N-methyltransferase SETMAR [Trichonephila clavipes]|nr:histone-lysine N-methyltransferase SETMAR [Trichonephila clavipes]
MSKRIRGANFWGKPEGIGESLKELSDDENFIFEDSAVNERTTRHWIQKFRSADLSFCDKARTGRPQALDGEALQVPIEEDNSVERMVNFPDNSTLSSETVILHLHRLGKTYRLSKWVPHTL